MHSPAHNVNKRSPAVQYVWFGWHWGIEKSLMLWTPFSLIFIGVCFNMIFGSSFAFCPFF
jgi:hypothetical protein